MKKVLDKVQIGWPMVALVAIIGALLLASYFLPDTARGELRSDLGWAWGAAATFLGPILQRRVSAALAPSTEKTND